MCAGGRELHAVPPRIECVVGPLNSRILSHDNCLMSVLGGRRYRSVIRESLALQVCAIHLVLYFDLSGDKVSHLQLVIKTWILSTVTSLTDATNDGE